jgi:hypothetical protein
VVRRLNPKHSICWVKRTGNQAAHALANWACNEPNKTWLYETPLCIQEIIKNDVSLCNYSDKIKLSFCQKRKQKPCLLKNELKDNLKIIILNMIE